MFWAREKIIEFFEKEHIVSGFTTDNVDCNSYTLSVGPEYFVSSDHRKGSWSRFGVQLFKEDRNGIPRGSCVIPSGQFAFLITHETVKMPPNTMGFISLKTKAAKFKGLVNISGFHVDPGFHGKLIFSVFNAGPSPIHIRAGDPLFLLWIADIDVTAERPENSIGVKMDKKPVDQIAAEITSNVADPLVSLQDISKKIESLDRKIYNMFSFGIILSSVLTFLLVVFNWTKMVAFFAAP